jgi:uncharacterized protein (DUF2147 family)
MRLNPLLLSTMVVLAASAGAANAAAPITGKWYTDGKDSIIEIAPCGTAMCGRVAKILKPRPGGPAVDANNPDPALRTRPILGLPILSAGKVYRSTVALLKTGDLRVKGCWGPFCRTVMFTPAG